MIFVGPGPRSVSVWAVPSAPASYYVSGTTRTSTGAIFANCTVEIYEVVSNLFRGSTISDANGNFKVEIAGDRTIVLQAVVVDPTGNFSGVSAPTLIAT
jgi:hypothetical protein